MRDDRAKPSWDSVDTVIRDSNESYPSPRQATPPLRVVNSFSGGLEPQTTPNAAIPTFEPDPEPEVAAPPPPIARGSLVKPPVYPSAPEPALGPKGQIIVVFGCRGGAGATMLAVNVAATLGRGGKSVVVVDLDLQLGDVFVALDVEAATSIAALAREAESFDDAALRRRLARHDSGIYALSQVGRLDDVDPELPERIPKLLGKLAESFDYVVIDGVRDFGDHALAAMDVADKIAMVVTQDVQAVRRASRVAQLFRRLGYSERKIHIILNRHSTKATVDEREIERVLTLPISATVRNDYPRLRKALDEGSLLHDTARGSGVHRDVERVARALLGDPQRHEPIHDDEEPGFFARLFRRGN
jgi:Flp pilus assembly CpaE family ATPase